MDVESKHNRKWKKREWSRSKGDRRKGIEGKVEGGRNRSKRGIIIHHGRWEVREIRVEYRSDNEYRIGG